MAVPSFPLRSVSGQHLGQRVTISNHDVGRPSRVIGVLSAVHHYTEGHTVVTLDLFGALIDVPFSKDMASNLQIEVG